jgi:ABC-type multidrug transport system fused ATPase/permease subunit
VLFNGTVFENVSYGLLGTEKAGLSSHDQLDLVKEACKAAYAEEFVEQLPKVRTSLINFPSPLTNFRDMIPRLANVP